MTAPSPQDLAHAFSDGGKRFICDGPPHSSACRWVATVIQFERARIREAQRHAVSNLRVLLDATRDAKR